MPLMDYLTTHDNLEQEEKIPEPSTILSEHQAVTSLDDDLTRDGSIDSTETPTPSTPIGSDSDSDIAVVVAPPPPSTRTTGSGLEHSWWIRVCLVVFKSLELTFQIVKPIMNAAVTIFGLGIGVGLILGDSWRGTTTMTNATPNATATASLVEEDMGGTANSTTTTSPATPTCRATIRRTRPRVQEAPDISLAGSQLPAQ
jgi:hypothetical protein